MNPMGPTGPYGQQPPYGQPQQPYTQPGPGMQPGGYEYEFDAVQNATISSAALWARILGVVLIVVGAASLLNCNIISFVLDLLIGIFFLGGGGSLASVVNTQGNDIAHMMQALSKLGTAFKIRVIVTIIAVVLILLFAIAAVLLVLATKSSR